MLLVIGYIVMWLVSAVAFNRYCASEDGEAFASEMLPLQVLGALLWPAVLPFVIICVACKLIINRIKGE